MTDESEDMYRSENAVFSCFSKLHRLETLELEGAFLNLSWL